MAKCKSHLMSVIRGSVAGITYTANTFCSIIARNRTIPTNTNTNRQQQIRSCFTQAKAIWPTLSRAIRDGWDAWARTVTLSGPTGDYTIPGRQWYMGIRATVYYLALRGVSFGTASNNAPVIHGLIPIPVYLTAKPTTGAGYKITFAPITTELLIAYAMRSGAHGDDKNFYAGPWNSETLLSGTQTLISDPITLERTDLVTGDIYFEHIRLISKQGPFRISHDLILRIAAQSSTADDDPVVHIVPGRPRGPRAIL